MTDSHHQNDDTRERARKEAYAAVDREFSFNGRPLGVADGGYAAGEIARGSSSLEDSAFAAPPPPPPRASLTTVYNDLASLVDAGSSLLWSIKHVRKALGGCCEMPTGPASDRPIPDNIVGMLMMEAETVRAQVDKALVLIAEISELL